MKNLLLFLLCTFAFLHSCQDDEMILENERIVFDVTKSKFLKDFKGKFTYDNIEVSINSFEINPSNSEKVPYYLFLRGIKQYPDEIKSVLYAVPLYPGSIYQKNLYYLTEAPIDGGGGGDCVIHKCESYDSLLFGCSQCEFVKDEEDEIIGCKCAQLGACLHSIEECNDSNNLQKSISQLNNMNEMKILKQFLNSKL